MTSVALDREQLALFAAPPPSKSPASAQADTAAALVRSSSSGFTFFLGTHHPAWLAQTDVPLFVSHRSLSARRDLPRARAPWALDSGGFTELSLHGRWMLPPQSYARSVARYAREVGQLAFAAVQDWMCEPDMLIRTGRTVAEHQAFTIQSYLELRALQPDLPWLPVLQGWTRGDYLDHLEQYAAAGVDLTTLPRVGLGSVCRRQHTLRAALLIDELAELGLRIHAFGFKRTGLASSARQLASSDSLAWSLHARKSPPLTECAHARCSNCLRFALDWRLTLLDGLR